MTPLPAYDFDNPPSRVGSGSYKWDEYPGELPLWVADMDFKTAPCVIEALRRRVDHGIFGYTYVRDQYYDSLIGWFREEHGYEFSRQEVIYTSGVVPAISAIIKALVPPGEGVIVMTPAFNCFFSSIRNNGCHIVECPLVMTPSGESCFSYRIDFNLLEELASAPSNRMLILCNPHNPGGRVWDIEELTRVRDICRRHGVQVLSDEIHCELTMPGYSYNPYGIVDSEAIVCLSPSKAFNTAGLQIANIICLSEEKRRLIDKAININEVCDVNPFGVEALIASYTDEGRQWLEEIKSYLAANWEMTRELFNSRLPQCPVSRLEATYLPWIDITPLALTGRRLAGIIEEECHIKISDGGMYGDDRFIRLNIACPRALLRDAIQRIIDTIERHLSVK